MIFDVFGSFKDCEIKKLTLLSVITIRRDIMATINFFIFSILMVNGVVIYQYFIRLILNIEIILICILGESKTHFSP